MNLLYGDSHFFHDVDAVFKGEYDSFLCRTNDMVFAVGIKIQSADATTDFFIAQHTFRAVTKGQNAKSGTSDGRCCCEHVHVIVRDTFGGDIAFYP